MEYRTICASNQIMHTVESYAFLKTDQPASYSDTFFPNGKPAIVFHFKSPFYYRNINGLMEPIPTVGFIGCQSVPLTIKNDGIIDSLTVLLHPYSLYNLFQVKLKGLFSHMDATSFFPEMLIRELAGAEEISERVVMLDNYFIEKLKEYNPEKDIFKAICDFIVLRKGNIERKDLSDNFSLSENYIHKLFVKKLGISFKPYSRIVRITNCIAEICSKKNRDWMELLMKYGYFDQSHFIKDFSKITGKTPLQFYKSDKTLSLIFSAMV